VLAVSSDASNGARLIGDAALVAASAAAGARTTVIHRGKALQDADALALLDSAKQVGQVPRARARCR
jgi:hypothetical protein